MSKLFIGLGIVFLLAGIILYFYPNIFHWFGKLPGDVRMDGKSGGLFFPIVSCIVLSVVLTIVLNLFLRR